MYRWVDHTAEVELHLEADSEADVFGEGLAALAELLGEATGGETVRHDVSLQAPDRATLLAEWLGELIFLAETRAFIPIEVERLDLGDAGLEAVVRGRNGPPSHLVKAVTYHRLGMWPEGESWRARVILDV